MPFIFYVSFTAVVFCVWLATVLFYSVYVLLVGSLELPAVKLETVRFIVELEPLSTGVDDELPLSTETFVMLLV